MDQTLWNLPFSGKSEMEKARRMACPPVRRRDQVAFESSMLEEHALPHARESLERSWAAWIAAQYARAPPARSWGRSAKAEDLSDD